MPVCFFSTMFGRKLIVTMNVVAAFDPVAQVLK